MDATLSPQAEPTVSPAEQERAERVARRFWVTGIVSLLGVQVLIGAAAIYLANSDETVAVIPDYYEKAVNWDATRRARERMLQLQWKTDTYVAAPVDNQRSVNIVLSDKNDEPLEGFLLHAKAFHHALGSEIHQLEFTEIRPGAYQANTSLLKGGQWQITLRIEGENGIVESVEDVWVD